MRFLKFKDNKVNICFAYTVSGEIVLIGKQWQAIKNLPLLNGRLCDVGKFFILIGRDVERFLQAA